MELTAIHPHAYVHGMTEEDIVHVWRNAFEWAKRDREDGKAEFIFVGVDAHGRLAEIVARDVGNDCYIVFHADTPPERRTLIELGLNTR